MGYIEIFVLCKFFSEVRDCHEIGNVKAFSMYGSWKIIQLNIRNASQIVRKFPGELKSQWKLTFYEPSDIGSPVAFLVNETLSFHEKFQNQSCVCILRNLTLSLKH